GSAGFGWRVFLEVQAFNEELLSVAARPTMVQLEEALHQFGAVFTIPTMRLHGGVSAVSYVENVDRCLGGQRDQAKVAGPTPVGLLIHDIHGDVVRLIVREADRICAVSHLRSVAETAAR